MAWGTVRAYLEWLPMLEARECLLSATLAAIGNSSSVRKGDVSSIMRAWRKQAGLQKVLKPKSKEEFKHVLGGMGIEVVHHGR